MRKKLRCVGICLLLALSVWTGRLLADKSLLRRELIRLHVVANSDSQEDQSLKLLVRDAVVQSLSGEMEKLRDPAQAREYLEAALPKLETLANEVLAQAGSRDRAAVKLDLEEFSTRVYDTFTLPAGVYESLRITIGEGQGANWWCVVFPSLCLPATAEGFEETADCAGFPDSLTAALEGKEGYEVRFFLLDALGKVENFFHKG